jgi:uncharacterized protein (DUF58 family)
MGRAANVGSAVRGLTLRGRAFLAAGLSAGTVGVLLGQRDLLRVGILLAALPLVSVWVVVRTRYRLACSRRLDPARVAVGENTDVLLRLDNVSRLPTGLLLGEDRLPFALGARPRFILDRVEPRGHRAVSYPVQSEVRGRYSVGPLAIRLTDPFGMCELRRSFSGRDTLTVTPEVQALPDVRLGGEWSGNGESRARSIAAAGEDDVATREYRDGDPLHRVHWRSTARHGELMVRREEQPWQSRATLLLDSRALAHRGEGAAASFEWAVSAAASIGVHLVRRGFGLRLLTEHGAAVTGDDAGGGDGRGDLRRDVRRATHEVDGLGGDVEGLLLDALAIARTSSGEDLREVVAALRRGGDSMIVAVLGGVTVEQAEELARARHGSTTAVCILLDVASWTVLAPRARDEAARTFDDVTLLLRSAGWRVLPARPGDSLPLLWERAAQGAGAAVLGGVS